MLHVMSALCVARDLHTNVPGPLDHYVLEMVCSEGIVRNLEMRL